MVAALMHSTLPLQPRGSESDQSIALLPLLLCAGMRVYGAYSARCSTLKEYMLVHSWPLQHTCLGCKTHGRMTEQFARTGFSVLMFGESTWIADQ